MKKTVIVNEIQEEDVTFMHRLIIRSFSLAAAAIALAGCSGGTSPIVPLPPAARDVILIETRFTGKTDAEVGTVRPDGKGRINLTNNATEDVTPTYSPDGRYIAFASNRNGGLYKLFLMGSDGSNVRQLTSGAGNDRFPSFSPDGGKLVFASDRDAPAAPLLATLPQPSAAVIAARRRVAQRNNGQGSRTRLIEAPGGKPEDIYVLTLASGAVQRLTNVAAGDTSPDFSPDGTRIVFESDRGPGRDDDIYIMNSNGSNEQQVTSNGALELNPRWSPDGSRIAFSAFEVELGTRHGLYTINPDGSNLFLVTNAGAFIQTYSPDGQRLTTGASFFTIRIDGTDPIVLIDETGSRLNAAGGDWR